MIYDALTRAFSVNYQIRLTKYCIWKFKDLVRATDAPQELFYALLIQINLQAQQKIVDFFQERDILFQNKKITLFFLTELGHLKKTHTKNRIIFLQIITSTYSISSVNQKPDKSLKFNSQLSISEQVLGFYTQKSDLFSSRSRVTVMVSIPTFFEAYI